jgi:putative peptide zinc metalloprotease protein
LPESLFSASWYRVAELVPRVRAHGELHRHVYRGQVWYVLQDHASNRSHRLSPEAHRIIGMMNGRRTLQEIWDVATEQLGDDAPSQDETIRLLAQLHSADVLQCDVPPDALEVFNRYEKQRRKRIVQRFVYPLAIHVPLLDPEKWLVRTMPLVRPVFTRIGLIVWLGVVATGIVLAATHWSELTEDIADRALSPGNLLWIWLAYPLVKAIHELGHAYAIKNWGGEVHEMGLMFLVLVPVPYVEASAAAAFRSKWKRVVVGAAGIMIELLLAALAMIVWVNVEPGGLRAFAYNVMLIGGVSTIFFNGNPLLRFDGYYVLADAIEIPNLAMRAKAYLTYLVERYAFGIRDAKSPATAPGEAIWFGVYGLAALAYRVMIVVAIILLIAGRFFIIGALIAVWAGITQFVVPVAKSLGGVVRGPRVAMRRRRAMTVVATALALAALIILLLPVPLWTRAEGVVWLPEEARVRAGANGFVAGLLVPNESRVRRGDALIETRDPLLHAQARFLEGRVHELEARLAALSFVDRPRADATRNQLESTRREWQLALEHLDALLIRSPADGVFVAPEASDLPGRYLRRGELVGWVAEGGQTVVRVAVSQADIDLVRTRVRDVQAVLADWDVTAIPARVIREIPAAGDRLPDRALGSAGGGSFSVDPRDPEGLKTMEKVFQLDIELPPQRDAHLLGRRADVRFDHGYEVIAGQLYRTLRQLFLSRFGI